MDCTAVSAAGTFAVMLAFVPAFSALVTWIETDFVALERYFGVRDVADRVVDEPLFGLGNEKWNVAVAAPLYAELSPPPPFDGTIGRLDEP